MSKTNVVTCGNTGNAAAHTNARRETKPFAEIVLSGWFICGPASGYSLFWALLQKAVNGPIATPERARAILPTLLEVLDDMGEAEFQAAHDLFTLHETGSSRADKQP